MGICMCMYVKLLHLNVLVYVFVSMLQTDSNLKALRATFCKTMTSIRLLLVSNVITDRLTKSMTCKSC